MEELLLPTGWKWTKLGEVCSFSQGIQVDIQKQSFEKKNGYVRFLRIIDFTQENEPQRYIKDPGIKYFLNKNEIAMVRYGTVGFVCTGKEGVIANNLFKIKPNEALNTKFLINILNSHLFKGKLKTKGATMQALSFGIINPISIPIPSLLEQQSIVSKIEELFSELDKGIENLLTAQQQLKTYRQSVLKWAFEGRLTSKDRINSGIPNDWKICTIGNLSPRVTVGHVGPMKNEYVNSGIPFLRGQNVKSNRYDQHGLKYISEKFHKQLAKSKIVSGDILVVRSGNVGTSCVVPDILNEANCSDLVIIKKSATTDSKFIAYYINSVIETKIHSRKVGVALTHFNTKSVENLELPLPSIDEQLRIVEAIENCFSVADKMEESITQSLHQAAALRQSILKKAFEGKLV